MKGKNLKHLSDGESWLLSILNEAERKVFFNAKLQTSEKAVPEKVHVQTNMPYGGWGT